MVLDAGETLVRFRPPSVLIGFVPQKLNLTAKLDWLVRFPLAASEAKQSTLPPHYF